MGVKTTSVYFCDVCETELGTQEPSIRMVVKCVKDGEWALVINCDWKHFCSTCENDILDFFEEMRKRK